MGKYDGLRQAVTGSGSTGTDSTSKGSKYDDLRMSMGLIEDTRPNLPDPSNERGNASMDESRLVNDSREQLVSQQGNNSFHIPALDFLNNKLGSVVEGISNFGNRAATSAMDALTFGQGKKQLTNNPDNLVSPTFQSSLRPAENGTERAADVLGSLYGSAAPIMGAYATGGKLATMGLSKLAPNAPKIVQTLTRGLGAGLAYEGTKGTLDYAIDPQGKTMEERLKDAALGTAMFAGGDAALGVAGSGLKMIAQKYAGTKLGDVLGKFFGNSPKTVDPRPQGPMLGLPEPRSAILAREAQQRSVLEPNLNPIAGQGDIHTFELPQGKYTPPTRLKVNSAEDSFHTAYEKVLPAAVERMTPPLENETLLSKWVQGHLNDVGHDVSLNEVRKLSYEDMRQLAEEMRGRLNPADVVRKTAHDMGYGKIYDQSTPTIKERIAQDAQNQVYGIYPKKVNITKPDSFNISKTEPAAAPESKLGFNQVNPKIERVKNIAQNGPSKVKTNIEPTPSALNRTQAVKQTKESVTAEWSNARKADSDFYDSLKEKYGEVFSGFNREKYLTPDENKKWDEISAAFEAARDNFHNKVWENSTSAATSDLQSPKIQKTSNDATIEDVLQSTEPRIRDKVVNFFDEAEQAARDRLKAKANTLSSNPIDQYADYAIIGASKLVKGSVKFVDWSAEMVREFGEEIRPHLKAIFDQSKSHVKEAERQASGVAHLPGVNSGIDPLKGNKADIMSLEKALENSAAWKDKNRLLLNRETTERNFEDVMGKDSTIMKKTYIEPIQEAAANRQRFITKERSDIKGLDIKYKSSEDALVQEYGESKITLDELKVKSPENWQKVKTAAETMRAKYDEYLNKANEVLKRNGYPEIPKRKDYFPHYEEMDGLLHKLGFGFEDNTLPSELNGLTANLKPGKNFFSHALQRKTNETTLGAMAGHDRYIEGISKIIYQTDNIKRLRGLDKTLRDTHEGTTHLSDFLANLTDYTNLLAGKKTELDRSLEAGIGRNIYSAVDWMKKRVGANMIGGSVSSALTNSIPVTQLLAETSKPSVLKGLTSALQNIKGNDAISQESNFLTRKFTSDKLAMGKLDKAQNVAGSLFKFIDHFTSNMVVRAKYFENLDKKGMPPAEAMKAADQYAAKMMADRSEGSMPTLFHSRSYGLITQFQLEVNNQISHLFKDMPKSMSKAKYAGAITQVFIYDYLYNQLYEKVTGNRPAFDPIGIAVHAFQDFGNPRLSSGKAKENLVKNVSNNLPFASVLTGGRIPIGSALPNVTGLLTGNAKLGDELMKPVKYLGLPFGGSQINKTITGLNAVSKGGEVSKNADGEKIIKYPIERSPANITRGALFGKNALSETDSFYRNNTPSLTAKETQLLDRSGNDPKLYDRILIQKEVNGLEDKIKKIAKSKDLTPIKKKQQIDDIVSKIRKVSSNSR